MYLCWHKVLYYTVLRVWETRFSLCVTANCDMYKILIIKISKFKIKVKVEDNTRFLGLLTSGLMFLDFSF